MALWCIGRHALIPGLLQHSPELGEELPFEAEPGPVARNGQTRTSKWRGSFTTGMINNRNVCSNATSAQEDAMRKACSLMREGHGVSHVNGERVDIVESAHGALRMRATISATCHPAAKRDARINPVQSNSFLLRMVKIVSRLIIVIALAASSRSFAVEQRSDIATWLRPNVGAGEGQIAQVVLQRARALYFRKMRAGVVRNRCYFAMDATRPHDLGDGKFGPRFYVICESGRSFRAISRRFAHRLRLLRRVSTTQTSSRYFATTDATTMRSRLRWRSHI